MTLTQVARKDFEDAVRSKMLWAIVAVFVGFVGFVVAVSLGTTDTADVPADVALGLTAQLSQLMVPLIALIAGYMAVVGERRSGSLRILLSYPHSRRDVVFGKLAGRGAVIALTLSIGSVLSILLIALLIESPPMGETAGLLASIVLFGVGFTGLAVGISASVGSRGKAMALAIGSLLAFLLVWDAAAAGLYAAVTGSLPGLHPDAWYFLVRRLSPINAFRGVAQAFADGRISTFFRMGVADVPADTPPEALRLANRVEGPLPFYLSPWFAGLTLLGWAVAPSVVGYLRFRRSDI